MRSFLLSLTLLATPVHAECSGQNLVDLLPETVRAALEERADAHPFAAGNFWTATKGDQEVTLVGTYHLGDPRHEIILTELKPVIEEATTVLVEAGPEEEKSLVDRIGKDPSVMILTDTTLPELLEPDDWQLLSSAMVQRGIPGFMAAKFQPWYISMLLATPACDLKAALDKNSLDAMIMEEATSADVPVRALEPYDTVFRIFDSLSIDDQIDMVRSSLAMESRAEDFSRTLADIYFSGQTRMIWELMRHESLLVPGASESNVDAELALMENAMMTTRNRNWIPVIEEAAAQGPVVVAFGALHMSGEDGVANLMSERGWTLTPFTDAAR